MKTKIVQPLMLFILLIGLFTPVAQVKAAQTETVQAAGISPTNLLNPDGTLNLNKGMNGALDLSRYNVAMDGLRGPVFSAIPENIHGSAKLSTPIGPWEPMGTSGGILNENVFTIVVSGSSVYLGGNFTNANGIAAADYIVKWDSVLNIWSALGSNGAGDGAFNNAVDAIAVIGTNVYVGGTFTNVNDNGTSLPAADYVSRWDGTHWYSLSGNGVNNGSLNGAVFALAADPSGNLYVGGMFTDVNDAGTIIPSADYIAKWNIASFSQWSALGSNNGFGGNGSLNNAVTSITVSSSNIYVGGYFTDVANANTILLAADFIARWDGANWSALGRNGAGNGALNGITYAMAVSGTNLYVVGSFTNIDNNGNIMPTADYVAKWDGVNWSALGSNGAGDGALDFRARSLAVHGTDVYVGGDFTDSFGLATADYIAKWNGASWSSLSSNGAGNGSLNNWVYALTTNGNDLYVGGNFSDVNNNGTVLGTADYLATYRMDSKQIFASAAAQDGWAVETSEISNLGGNVNASAINFVLGDNASKQQYRGILSFNTSALPDTAVLTGVALKVKKQSIVGGGNPLAIFQGLMIDIKTGFLGTSAVLQASDFQTTASKTLGPTSPALVNNWYTINLTGGKDYINKLSTGSGLTQIRLRFKLDDNNDAVANYLSLYSGNTATAADRPQLMVTYYVP